MTNRNPSSKVEKCLLWDPAGDNLKALRMKTKASPAAVCWALLLLLHPTTHNNSVQKPDADAQHTF